MNDYFVKAGYVHNLDATSYDPDSSGEVYWTQQRLGMAGKYQFYVYQFARQLMEENGFTSVADVGCGPAVKSGLFFSDESHDVVLFDQKSVAEVAKTHVPSAEFVDVDLEHCQVPIGRTYDLVICADVLEHLKSPIPCIDFCKRLCSPGGRLVFSTPERDRLRGLDASESGHPQHVREWNDIEFRKLLESRGLTTVDEFTCPGKKLSLVDSLFRLLTNNRPEIIRWNDCQVKVCQHLEAPA
jgi:SAM-dependent methyltransferase